MALISFEEAIELMKANEKITAVWKQGDGTIILCFREPPDEKELFAFAYDNVKIFVTGEFYPLSFFMPKAKGERSKKWRPAPAGVSVGHYKVTAGTLGLNCYDKHGKLVLLSNNHVIANTVTEEGHGGMAGDPIFQPGPYDGGRIEDTIAKLYDVIPLSRSKTNLVDAALGAVIDPSNVLIYEVYEYGTVRKYTKVLPGTYVTKSGRTTGIMSNVIVSTNAAVRVNYGEAGTYFFEDQIIVAQPFAQPGDSGSPVMYRDALVGLVFAGSYTLVVVCKAEHIVKLLDLDLEYVETPGPPGPPGPPVPREYEIDLDLELEGKYKLFRFEFPLKLRGKAKGTAKSRE